jgi:hypothetical protein
MEKDAKDERGHSARGSASDGSRLVYVPRGDATPEAELAALTAVYRFVLECAQRRKANEAGDDGEDAGGGEA